MTAEVETRHPVYKATKQASAAALPWALSIATLVVAWITLTVAIRNEKALATAMARQERYIVTLEEIRRDLDTLRHEVDRLSERYAPRGVAPKPPEE